MMWKDFRVAIDNIRKMNVTLLTDLQRYQSSNDYEFMYNFSMTLADNLRNLNKFLNMFIQSMDDDDPMVKDLVISELDSCGKDPESHILETLLLKGEECNEQERLLVLAGVLYFWLNNSPTAGVFRNSVQAITKLLQSKSSPDVISDEDKIVASRFKGLLASRDLRGDSEELMNLLVRSKRKFD